MKHIDSDSRYEYPLKYPRKGETKTLAKIIKCTLILIK